MLYQPAIINGGGGVGDAGSLFLLQFLGQGMYQEENSCSFAHCNILCLVEMLQGTKRFHFLLLFVSPPLFCGEGGGFTFCVYIVI